MRVNAKCQSEWIKGFLDSWERLFLGMSIGVFLEETDT